MNAEIMTKEQVAKFFQVKPVTIMRWVDKGMPCSDKTDGLPRFLKEDCIDWKFKKGMFSNLAIKIPKELCSGAHKSVNDIFCGMFTCSAERVDCVNCAFYSEENFNEFIKQCGL